MRACSNRAPGPGYQGEWYEQQCGGRLHYRPLAGRLGLAYGAYEVPLALVLVRERAS